MSSSKPNKTELTFLFGNSFQHIFSKSSRRNRKTKTLSEIKVKKRKKLYFIRLFIRDSSFTCSKPVGVLRGEEKKKGERGGDTTPKRKRNQASRSLVQQLGVGFDLGKDSLSNARGFESFFLNARFCWFFFLFLAWPLTRFLSVLFWKNPFGVFGFQVHFLGGIQIWLRLGSLAPGFCVSSS